MMDLAEKGFGDEEMVLRNSDVKDVEDILARKSMVNQLGQALEQAKAEIKDLEGDKQRSDAEIIHLRQSVEVGKFKGRLKEDEIRAHQSTLLFTERLNDILKNIRAQA